MAALKGASSLTKILWLTANLLFEKGETPDSVHNFLQVFVEKGTVRKWHKKFLALRGDFRPPIQSRSIPLPPIDFDAISLPQLQSMLEPPRDGGDDVV